MSHVQVSLLGGSSQLDPSKRYRPARYDFGSGPGEPSEFFAAALLRHVRPDRLVILGTSGSMWDVLLESLEPSENHHDLLLELIDAAAADRVTQAQLDALAPRLEAILAAEVRLRLIPYGRNPAEQLDILQRIAADIDPEDTVSLDVTHGLRHLPMLAQMSALYLRKARRVTIRGIYYGALDMTRDNVTPVMDLKGLLEIADWVGALHTFDKDGDYGVFQPLLTASMGDDAALLNEAAFFERTNRPGDARGRLRRFRTRLAETSLAGIARLFEGTLRSRTDWVEGQQLYQRQALLARQYLDTDDYLRATMIGFEAFITRQVAIQGLNNPDSHTERDRAKKHYEERRPCPDDWRAYQQLRNLRNSLAHGDRNVRGEAQRDLSDPQRLKASLTRLFDQLLPERIR